MPSCIRRGILLVGLIGLVLPGQVAAQTPSNVAALTRGGRLVSFSTQYNATDWKAANILDGKPNVGWCSLDGSLPQTLVVELPGEFLISRFSFDNGTQEGSYPGISAREVKIAVSLEAEDVGYREVGTFTLKKGESAQGFKLASPVRARWIKLNVLSNHGYASYTELMEFRAIGLPAPGQAVQVARPSNVAALTRGGRLVSFSTQYNATDWKAANILDGKPNVGWCSLDGSLPQTLVVELPGEFLISRFSFDNGTQEGSYPGISAREVKIAVSLEAEDVGYREVGTFTLKKGESAQGFKLASPVRARWIKLNVLSNHGYASYTELMEFRAIGLPARGQTAVTEKGFRLTLAAEVLFDTDQFTLRPEAQKALIDVLAILWEYPTATLLVEGHTDSIGAPEHNQELSEARANTVKEWLAAHRGDARWQIVTQGWGARKPAASNATPEGRRRNRRVEITLVR